MTILEQLEQRDQFTDIEEFIAEYILAHREEIYGWNLASLAKATCSSNATIVRMCRKLGFKGYKDFHIAFVVELEKQRREKREVDFDRPFSVFPYTPFKKPEIVTCRYGNDANLIGALRFYIGF